MMYTKNTLITTMFVHRVILIHIFHQLDYIHQIHLKNHNQSIHIVHLIHHFHSFQHVHILLILTNSEEKPALIMSSIPSMLHCCAVLFWCPPVHGPLHHLQAKHKTDIEQQNLVFLILRMVWSPPSPPRSRVCPLSIYHRENCSHKDARIASKWNLLSISRCLSRREYLNA